jgi:hypothetical protein
MNMHALCTTGKGMDKMKHRLLGLMVVALTACGGKGDDCQRFWDKASPVMQKMAGDKQMPANAKEQFLKECRADDKLKKDTVFACVLDAKGEAAVSDCMSKAFGDYVNKGKKTEAEVQLNKLGKNLKVYYLTNNTFPLGKVGPTPAEPCCKAAGGKCSTQDWATTEVWMELDFMVTEPHLFQYAYESDGKTATATAIGDLDCDGTPIRYTLRVSPTPDGAVTADIAAPPAGAD